MATAFDIRNLETMTDRSSCHLEQRNGSIGIYFSSNLDIDLDPPLRAVPFRAPWIDRSRGGRGEEGGERIADANSRDRSNLTSAGQTFPSVFLNLVPVSYSHRDTRITYTLLSCT